MADHHLENNGNTSPQEESPQYQNGNSVSDNDLVYTKMPHFNMYSHHVDTQYSANTYLSNEIVDLSKHDRESVIEESPNQRYAKLNTVLGKGAYKVVYKAIDREEGYEVAWNCFQVRRAHHQIHRDSNLFNFHYMHFLFI